MPWHLKESHTENWHQSLKSTCVGNKQHPDVQCFPLVALTGLRLHGDRRAAQWKNRHACGECGRKGQEKRARDAWIQTEKQRDM